MMYSGVITEESAQPRALSSGSMSVLRVRVSSRADCGVVAFDLLLERLDDAYELAELCVVMGFGHDPSFARDRRAPWLAALRA